MAKSARKYLNMRGLKYWFKREIPHGVRVSFENKTAYLVNLQTSDLREALKRRDELVRETNLLFEQARHGLLPTTNADPILRLAEIWLKEIEEANKNEYAWTAKITHRQESDVLDDEVLSPYSMIEDEAEAISRQHGEQAAERFQNLIHGHVAINHHAEAYLNEAQLAPKTTNERRNLINTFSRWADNEGHTLTSIDRAIAGRYYSNVIAPMHPSTAKKHLGSVKLYWDYLLIRGHIQGENPWENQTLQSRRRRVERGSDIIERPFTEQEISTLLYAEFPKGMRIAFKQQIEDAMRISALSGMRLAEIITLWVEECPLDQDGIGFFNIQQGKTSAAARKVPIHPDLVDIVRRRSQGKKPQDWLFHELENERDPGDIFGKRFAKYREKLGVDDKRAGRRRSLVNFHSFRRWFVTEAERAGQPESTISQVVGHEEGRKSITFKVYSGGTSDRQRRQCVEAVMLPSQKIRPINESAHDA